MIFSTIVDIKVPWYYLVIPLLYRIISFIMFSSVHTSAIDYSTNVSEIQIILLTEEESV